MNRVASEKTRAKKPFEKTIVLQSVLTALFLMTAAAPLSAQITGSEQEIAYDGKPIFTLHYLSVEESASRFLNSKDSAKLTWTLDDFGRETPSGRSYAIDKAVESGVRYWSELIGAGIRNSLPLQILVRTEDEESVLDDSGLYVGNGKPSQNATAQMFSQTMILNETGRYVPQSTDDEFAKRYLQTGGEIRLLDFSRDPPVEGPGAEIGYFVINVGKWLGANTADSVYGWYIDSKTLLPENGAAADLVGTIRHEMGHALGIMLSTFNPSVSGEEVMISYTDSKGEALNVITGPEDEEFYADSFAAHLVDENGIPMKAGSIIIRSVNDIETVTQALRDAHLIASDATLSRDKFFIVSDEIAKDSTQGKAYFKGANVSDVLDGARFDGVDGLPVNGWEGDEFEGSHLQTQGMMSHMPYSNFTTFLEVELAVMQDIGYSIDRKNLYGFSLYKDGVTLINTNGYSARNAEGTAYLDGVPNATPLGIGLHIYGSRNHVTQAADILTVGAGAAGIRVDGSENTLTLAKGNRIVSDGEKGIGILVSYGKNQIVNVDGDVSAAGVGGIALRLDFGDSTNGAVDEYRGSYIQYNRSSESTSGTGGSGSGESGSGESGSDESGSGESGTSESTSGESGSGGTDASKVFQVTSGPSSEEYTADPSTSFSVAYASLPDELKGALVSQLNVTGTVKAAAHAIYIGKNAFVADINLAGAAIAGDITSDWLDFANHDGDSTVSSYYPNITVATENNVFDPSDYIPSLVTNLNVKGNVLYQGNISGARNMRLNVSEGCLSFSGRADLTSVAILPGAKVEGGDYRLHYFAPAETEGPSDGFQLPGTFVNRGTLSTSANADITISAVDSSGATISKAGDEPIFVSDGDLIGVMKADGTGAYGILIEGRADLNGSSLYLLNALPGEEAVVVSTYASLARSASGIVNSGQSQAVPVSGLLSNYVIEDGSGNYRVAAIVNEQAINELGAEGNVFAAINRMQAKLASDNDPRRHELRAVYALGTAQAREALNNIGNNDPALSAAALAQRSDFVGNAVASRLKHFSLYRASGDERATRGDVWIRPFDSIGVLGYGFRYKSYGIMGGLEGEFNPQTRLGWFAAYNVSKPKGHGSQARLGDFRSGFYTVWESGPQAASAYTDFGRIHTRTHRSLSHLGLRPSAKYDSLLLEAGGRYRYDFGPFTAARIHVAPYVAADVSYLRQKAFDEKGAGVLNMHMKTMRNTAVTVETGAEIRKEFTRGNVGLILGINQALKGNEPKMRFSYQGDPESSYSLQHHRGSTLGVVNLSSDAEIAKKVTLSADAELRYGSHERDLYGRLSVTYRW